MVAHVRSDYQFAATAFLSFGLASRESVHRVCSTYQDDVKTQCKRHYYTKDYAQRSIFALRGGHLFSPAAVNATIYRGGHFLFIVAGTFARHGKSIYLSGRLKMPATENMYFPWRAC